MVARITGRALSLDRAPHMVRAGEIHYFRLDRDHWGPRLRLLSETGADTVASYIPWVVHERADGRVDLTGKTRPELDLGAFIDLAAETGLRFLARPGPFTMGELRHEGIPARVRAAHPELQPIGWDGIPTATADLDVAAPAFLAEADRWYAQLGPVLAPRVESGAVIGLQLDNEIGMLSWVANAPVLTDDLLTELRERTAGTGAYPPRDAALQAWRDAIRSPTSALAADLRVDLADLHRDRAARYVAALAASANRHGFGDVPLLINVHGTEASSARPLGIGISQLQRAVAVRPDVIAGSDHYIGALDFAGAADLLLVHAFLAAATPGKPITVLEHETGTGDYSNDLAHVVPPEAVEQKTRLLLGRGVRLFNWYLFAGGTNFTDPRPEDAPEGGHRFGITGQRHGAGAPVSPEGDPTIAYSPAERAMAAAGIPEAAVWEPETDQLRIGWLPSQFATEHLHPADTAGRELVEELQWGRGGGPGWLLPRMLLAGGYRFAAADLEAAAPGDLAGQTVVVGTGNVLDEPVQQLLLDHVTAGGRLLLLGDLPTRDLRGRPATLLAEGLGIRRLQTLRSGPGLQLAVRPGDGIAGSETTVGRLSHLEAPHGRPVLVDAATGTSTGIEVALGAGRAVILTADGPGDPAFYRTLLGRLGCTPALHAGGAVPGLILQTTRTPAGQRHLHLLDTLGYGQQVTVTEHGRPLFDQPLRLAPRAGTILPIPG